MGITRIVCRSVHTVITPALDRIAAVRQEPGRNATIILYAATEDDIPLCLLRYHSLFQRKIVHRPRVQSRMYCTLQVSIVTVAFIALSHCR
jgi:hypothetical protein